MSYYQLRLMCKYLKIRMPRNKYEEQWTSITITAISVRGRIKKQPNEPGAVIFIGKDIRLLNEIENRYQEQLELSKAYYQKIKIIRKVLKQQQEIFETGKSVPIVL